MSPCTVRLSDARNLPLLPFFFTERKPVSALSRIVCLPPRCTAASPSLSLSLSDSYSFPGGPGPGQTPLCTRTNTPTAPARTAATQPEAPWLDATLLQLCLWGFWPWVTPGQVRETRAWPFLNDLYRNPRRSARMMKVQRLFLMICSLFSLFWFF